LVLFLVELRKILGTVSGDETYFWIQGRGPREEWGQHKTSLRKMIGLASACLGMEVFELSLIISSSVVTAVSLLLFIYFTFVKTRNVSTLAVPVTSLQSCTASLGIIILLGLRSFHKLMRFR
jgi:hypothetical protein